jgi:ubiquinone biosynthesis protein UbiJ
MIDFNQPPAVRPIDRGEAVAPEVERRDLRGLPLAGILRVFNHLLRQQQWARERLAVHGGKRLRIGVDPQFVLAPLTPNLFARISHEGLLERCEPAQTDVALWLMHSSPA